MEPLDLRAQIRADRGAFGRRFREQCSKFLRESDRITISKKELACVLAERFAEVVVRDKARPAAAHRFPRDFITKPGRREIHMHRTAAIMLGQLAAGYRARESNGICKAKLRRELLQFARIDFVVRAGGRAEDDETNRNSQKCSGAQERGMIFNARNAADTKDEIVTRNSVGGGREERGINPLPDDRELVFSIWVSVRETGHHSIREEVREPDRKSEIRMRIPSDERNAARAENRPAKHRERRHHVRETTVDALRAKNAKEMAIKFQNAARLGAAMFFSDRMHTHVRRDINHPGAHRDDVDGADARSQLANPLRGKTENGIARVGNEIEKKKVLLLFRCDRRRARLCCFSPDRDLTRRVHA